MQALRQDPAGESARASPERMRWFEVLLATAVCLVSVLYAKTLLASTLSSWDDEGYMLLSLRSYLKGAALYTDTFTQYGPFYFFVQEFWFRLLHLPVTHSSGRVLTLIYWLVSAGLAGSIIYRFSRNLLLAAGAFGAVTIEASVLANEPGHPQQVILVLLLASIFLSLWMPRSPQICFFLLGAIGSGLIFTKINVAGFYLLPVTHSLLCLLPRSRVRTFGVAALWLGALAFPYLMMRPNLQAVAGYCLVSTACGVTTFACGTLLNPAKSLRLSDLAAAAAAGVISSGAIVIGALAKHISIATLIKGVVLEPGRHPSVFFIPLSISAVQTALVVLGLACSASLTWLVLTGRMDPDRDWIGLLRCLAGLCATALLLGGHLGWALPVIPLVLIPLAHRGLGRDWVEFFPRLFLVDLAAMQVLQAYPVAGSQVRIASIPVVLCALLCFSDGVSALRRTITRFASVPMKTIAGGVAAILCAVVITRMWIITKVTTLNLPLSDLASWSVTPRQSEGYQTIVSGLRANCDMLFTMPGMGSFNLWSGVEPPNGANFTAWVTGFTIDRQDSIMRILRSHPRACVVYNEELLKFWHTSDSQIADSPLALYILGEMVTVVKWEAYEIRVQRWRQDPWVR